MRSVIFGVGSDEGRRARGLGRPAWRRTVLGGALALALALAGCSGSGDTGSEDVGSDGTGDGSAEGPDGVTTDEPAGVEALPSAEPEPPTDMEARVVLGAELDVALTVQACERNLGARPDGQVPAEQVAITATGARDDGTPVLLDVRRFVSAGAAPTITDTVTVLVGTEEAPERVLVAQRFEVGGLVTDLRDPDADDPLLRVGEQAVEARAVFAPPGAAAGDDGLADGIVLISCRG